MIGSRFTGGIRKNSRISDVRGLGAMVACELVDPATEARMRITQKRAAGAEEGLLLLTCGVYGNDPLPVSVDD